MVETSNKVFIVLALPCLDRPTCLTQRGRPQELRYFSLYSLILFAHITRHGTFHSAHNTLQQKSCSTFYSPRKSFFSKNTFHLAILDNACRRRYLNICQASFSNSSQSGYAHVDQFALLGAPFKALFKSFSGDTLCFSISSIVSRMWKLASLLCIQSNWVGLLFTRGAPAPFFSHVTLSSSPFNRFNIGKYINTVASILLNRWSVLTTSKITVDNYSWVFNDTHSTQSYVSA